MDALIKILLSNPALISAIIEPIIKAIIEQSAEHPDAFAEFIKSLIALFDVKK